MKRILSILLAIILLVSEVPMCMSVRAASVSDLTFTLNPGRENYSVTDCRSLAKGELSIPSTYDGKPVTSITASFTHCSYLTSIIIPKSVFYIDSSFLDCDSLTKIKVSEENEHFSSVDGILFNKDKTELIRCPINNNCASYIVPDSVTSLSDYAFYGCKSLTSITVSDHVTTIGASAFKECKALKNAVISDSVISVGENAFDSCFNLASVTLGAGVTSIGDHAFYNCDDLTSIIIPNSVTSIGEEVFKYCGGLTDVTIGNAVITIGNHAFYYCTQLKTVKFNAINCTTMGSLSYPVFENCTALTTVIIGDAVTKIPALAFCECYTLTNVTFGNNVTAIGDLAFYNCYKLTNFIIPNDVIVIGNYAFYECHELTNLIIPDRVTTIGDYAFYNCYKLANLVIGDNVITIGDYAFSGCKKITCLAIPNNVITIGVSAFSYCNSLTDLTMGNGVITIGNNAFDACVALTNIIIPNSVTTIGNSAFYGCTALTTVEFNAVNCAEMGTFTHPVFEGCTALNTIVIGDDVTAIPDDAFHGYTTVTDITIGKDVATIGKNAFANCKNLKTVNFNATNCITMGSESSPVFEDCTALTTVIIGDNVTVIPAYAFYNCYSLAEIVIPDKVKTIGMYAFYQTDIISVTLGKAVDYIASSAFDKCYELVRVYNRSSDVGCYYNQIQNAYVWTGVASGNDFLKSVYWYYNSCVGAKEHTFSENCDTICNKCGDERMAMHSYEPTFDTVNHFEKCRNCGDTVNVVPHCFDDACDMTCDCGFERTVTHNYQDTYNAVNHFEECTICGNIGFGEPHIFDNDCDTNCDCGYVRKVTHSYGQYVYNNDATTQKDGTKTRTCSVCGNTETVTATGTKLQTKNPFTDVKKSDFYYTPVLWAVENGITSGTSKTTFGPNEACTRGQIATFLWRAAGCPTPKTSKNPFTDVKKSDYYYKAVLWAVGEGITSGTSKTTFGPNEACTRGQIATFLWRANGGKKVNASNPFKDVKKSDYYYNAVLWAVKNKITSGTSATTFSPNEACTRGQIATFLYRNYN